MITLRYINGLDVESDWTTKWLPHLATPGFPPAAFYQGASVSGYLGGRAYWLFNNASGESVDAMPLGAVYQRVVFRCWMQWFSNLSGGVVPEPTAQQLFLRFENGANGWQICLQHGTVPGQIRVVLGGNGTNSTLLHGGTVLGTFSMTFGQWHDIEVRIDFGAGGAVRIWKDNALALELASINPGTGCDRVTFRGEGTSIGHGFIRDHIVIGTSDTATPERIGPCRVMSVPILGDYAISSDWTPNGGSGHWDRLRDSVQVTPFSSPDGDVTRLDGTGASGEELFALTEPDCVGKILAVAWNIGSKATAGLPTLQARLLDSVGVRSTIGSWTPESARYAVQQAILGEQPDGNDWTDRALVTSAWGFRGAGSGDMRVTSAYLEKVVDLTGLPYDCGAGSYIL